MEALQRAAAQLGLPLEQLLHDTARLALGPTGGTNAMLQRRGVPAGRGSWYGTFPTAISRTPSCQKRASPR
jgi:hypothetical protein